MRYICKTETGSVYVLDYDNRWVTKNGVYLHGLVGVKSVPSMGNRDPNLYQAIQEAPLVEFPAVGDRMYVSGGHLTDWALTNNIVSVEKEDE